MNAASSRRLLLLRHAKSSWGDPSVADVDRPLNRRGREAAGAVGAYLAAERLVPDYAAVSISRRTRETWSLLSREIAYPPEAAFVETLYHADSPAMLRMVQESPDDARCVLLLGHNPGMSALAFSLAGGSGVRSSGARFLKFPTAALAVFSVSTPRWAEFRPGDAKIERFVDARSLTG